MGAAAQASSKNTQKGLRAFLKFIAASTLLSGCCYGVLVVLVLLVGIVGVSIYAVIASAFEIDYNLGVFTLGVTGVSLIVYFVYLSPTADKKRSNIKAYIQAYTNLQVLMAILGFVQVTFWMIEPANPFQEPRSVFVISVSAFLAYLRSEIPKWKWLEALENQEEPKEVTTPNQTQDASLDEQSSS